MLKASTHHFSFSPPKKGHILSKDLKPSCYWFNPWNTLHVKTIIPIEYFLYTHINIGLYYVTLFFYVRIDIPHSKRKLNIGRIWWFCSWDIYVHSLKDRCAFFFGQGKFDQSVSQIVCDPHSLRNGNESEN